MRGLFLGQPPHIKPIAGICSLRDAEIRHTAGLTLEVGKMPTPFKEDEVAPVVLPP